MGATGKDLHIDVPLSNVAITYRPSGMIADLIFPQVGVRKESDSYLIWERAEAFRISDARRSRGTEANKIEWEAASATYFVDNWALKSNLVLEDRVNMDAAYQRELRQNRVMRLKDDLMLGWEQRIANTVNSTSNVGSSSAVTSNWSDLTAGNSDPIGDIEQAIENIRLSTGYRPNRLVIGQTGWRNLKRHADIISAVWGTSGRGGSRFARREQIAELFELDTVLIGNAVYNSNQQGQSASLADLWGDNVLLYYTPDRPTRETPSYGYSFRWEAAGIPNMQAEVHPFDRKTKSEEVELGYYQDEKVTATDLAFLITGVNSSV
jgi:hypothetical protein